MVFALDPVSALGETLRQVMDVLVTLLPLLLVGLLIFVLWRSLQAMPRPNTKAIKPYRGKTVRWADVAGLEEAPAELAEIVELLRDPGRFRKLGVRVPKGVLLHGPPGTGKTLLARAVAGESGAAFFSQSASAFDEVYTGLGAARIRKLFEAARKHAPAIVFIDELDAVGVTRHGSMSGEQALNQLLVELDGF